MDEPAKAEARLALDLPAPVAAAPDEVWIAEPLVGPAVIVTGTPDKRLA